MAREEGEDDSSTGLVIQSDRDWTSKANQGLQSATDLGSHEASGDFGSSHR
jgi:hypothetical protein